MELRRLLHLTRPRQHLFRCRPTKTAESPKPSETKLAKTGTYAGVLAVLVLLIAAFGSITYIASRKEDN